MSPAPRPRVAPVATALIVLFPLVFFLAIEGALTLLGLGDPADQPDPFIGLLEGHRIFTLDPSGARYTIERDRARSFNVQSFPARKPEGTRRIFCLGGSAAFGYPFGAPVAFPHWLAEACARLWPTERFEVVNAAGMSYGSFRIRALLTEILDHDPDLVVLYSGHNEFIEKDFYLQSRASRLVGLRALLARTHTYTLLKGLLRPAPRGAGFDEFGLHVTRRENIGWNDEERARVLEKYAENLSAITRRLEQAGVPLLLLVPAPNLGDWRPEHSVLSPGLAESTSAAWSAAWAEGSRRQAANDAEGALTAYAEALALDERYAELHYRIGQCLETLGRDREAAAAYERALDHDEVPIRITSAQRRALRAIGAGERRLFADGWTALAAVAPQGILGGELFWDYCHPNVRGHQRIAALACSALAHGGWLPEPALDGPWTLAVPVHDWSDADLARLGLPQPDSLDLVPLPKAADGLWWLGNCADRQGDRDAAISAYRRSLSADPNHPGSLIGLAIARSLDGDQEEAIELTRRALRIYEQAGMAQLALRARAELGVFYARAERMEEAVAEFTEVLRRNPTQPKAHANLARALVALGRLDEARSALTTGIQRLPEERGLHRELGRVHQLQGRPVEAIAAYEAERRRTPGDPALHRLLADLCTEVGRRTEAVQHLEALVRSHPEDLELRRRLDELRGSAADR